jgi:hypothetical protein
MKSIFALLLCSCSLFAAEYYQGGNGVVLPDPQVTPGKADPKVTQANIRKTICNKCVSKDKDGKCTSYVHMARNVTESTKKKVYAEYGVEPKPGECCEVDHLISIELGGSEDISNLWPQPYEPRPGAHEKDVLEDDLGRQVCSGTITLREAQSEISANWYAAYLDIQKKQKAALDDAAHCETAARMHRTLVGIGMDIPLGKECEDILAAR